MHPKELTPVNIMMSSDGSYYDIGLNCCTSTVSNKDHKIEQLEHHIDELEEDIQTLNDRIQELCTQIDNIKHPTIHF